MYGEPLNLFATLTDEDPRDPSYIGESDFVQRHKDLLRIISRWNEVWDLEYLPALHDYYYGATNPCNIIQLQPVDVVLVDSESTCSEWPIDRIVSVHPDSQGLMKIVKVKYKATTSLMSVEKLALLELAGEEVMKRPTQLSTIIRDIHPVCNATHKCTLKLKQYFNNSDEE